jgi:hypothetical protein
LTRFARDKIGRLPNLLVWLLIALVAGQAPALAYAACCAEKAAVKPECCCVETSCTAPPSGDVVVKMAPRADGCCCVEKPAPLPAHTPNPPAERCEFPTRSIEPCAVPVLPAIDSAHDCELYSWPPGARTSTLASVRVVVLLI